MRLKVVGITGADKVITIGNDKLLKDLLEVIEVTGDQCKGIRFGYPPQKVDITEENLGRNLEELGLSTGEKVTLISDMPKDVSSSISGKNNSPPVELKGNQVRVDETNNEILQIHEVPDDNSCLFHSISYTKHQKISLTQILREICAQEILSDKAKYNAAILDQSNEDYARWILQKDAWGGGIEIGILSDYLKIAIYVLDLDTLTIGKFNEDKFDDFVIISFNGVHYDAVELLYRQTNVRKTVFNLISEPELCGNVLEKTIELGKKLRSSGYKFNTRKDKIKCNVCKAEFVGEREVARHAESSGHYDFGQV
ncbi:Zinc finger C2H2 type domain signature [Nakaseomyces glabratus]|nr:Zinc finger C2H2 type domain signature [Nakaseomyces glabratus]KAH7583457.1 Zinc finger C2H2 type domain signature [Nakaseomyces glabratus]KAH7584880.1 Zinc finger C2H2 type domain signature [Nakaseomyces glabratus]KAH7596481.1 Zinc finger C2H2 type domain signature [Nakaseomyces glabratus]KAH7612050.1 OTU-like cysteine protease [Nakaseomyces glabratus]